MVWSAIVKSLITAVTSTFSRQAVAVVATSLFTAGLASWLAYKYGKSVGREEAGKIIKDSLLKAERKFDDKSRKIIKKFKNNRTKMHTELKKLSRNMFDGVSHELKSEIEKLNDADKKEVAEILEDFVNSQIPELKKEHENKIADSLN